MSSATAEVVARLQMLGLKCEEVPVDRVTSPISAPACFPMYMVANVHGWTTDHQFKVPFFDIQGLEAWREAYVIGKEEGRLDITREHRKVVDSMLTPARAPDRVVYEYAIDTLKKYLAVAQPGAAERVRTMVADMIVHVAKAAGKGLFSSEKVSPQERECISHIATELQLATAPKAAEVLGTL